jgi:hypothetical protein
VGKNPKNGPIARRHKPRRRCRTALRQGAWRRAVLQWRHGLWHCSITRRRQRHPKSPKKIARCQKPRRRCITARRHTLWCRAVIQRRRVF